MEEFKKKIDKLVAVMEECFDENNPNDGRTFDERLNQRLAEDGNEDIKQIFDENDGFTDFCRGG